MMNLVLAGLAGALIGVGLSIGSTRTRRRGLQIVIAVALVVSVYLLITVGTSTAGLVYTAFLIIAYVLTGPLVWRGHPSLDGMSFMRRAIIVTVHNRLLREEDAAIKAN